MENNKNITYDKIIKDKNILELIIKAFENDIKKDIQDENLKYESNNTSYNNVYGKYLKNNQILFPVKIPQKNYINYNEFKKIENNFIFLTEKYKNENSKDSKEGKSTIYRKKKPKLKLDEKKIILYWKKISDKLEINNKISSFFLLKSIIKLKAGRILEKNNNNINIRKDLSLKDKILIYKILLKSKNKSSIFNNNRKLIKVEDNKTYENLGKIKMNNILKKNMTPILNSNSNSNSKYYFSLSSNLNMKNLDEIIDIEDANIKIYKKQKIMKTQLTPDENFIDELFPPSKTLFGVNKINSGINIGRIDDIFLSENNNNNNTFYAILPEKDEFDKNNIIIKKGLWKNYYFLDVIYSLLKYPSIIYKLFPSILRAKNGLYGINLRINGIWKLILIDDYIPYLVDQQYKKFFCYSSLNDSFIWLSLLEKAYSKLCGGYDKIQDGEVTEILDILTDTCTEKYELVCFNKLYLISKLKQDININKYIVFAKANSNTSFNIGLLQDGNYLIEEIKVFKKGEANEYALKMRNNFSGKTYRGAWSKDSKSRIPFLKNDIPESDTEFYISIDELINYFSSLYICKIHPIENGNEYFSECIHYSKNEVNFPNIAVIDISNDTNIIIQFHQKNPKFNNLNNTSSVTSYMIITDIDYEYIDSVSSPDSNYSIELNLKKGKYFLISDIIYRYIFSIDNYHGYTINTYSKEKINLLKNNENNLNLNINHKEVITNAVINYSNKSLAPKRHELDLDIYEQNLKNRNKFPFLFILFDNSSSDFDKNINIKINNINNSITKNYAYYLDFENLNSVNINEDEINDSLSQKEIKLIMVLKLKEQFNFKINYHITPKITEEQLIEYTKIYGVSEELDEDGKIIQYLIEYDDGFIVLIENKYDNELFKMKLIMTGLICLNINSEEQENIVYFDLNGEETKFFKLKTKDNNNSGVVSFQFQFAD